MHEIRAGVVTHAPPRGFQSRLVQYREIAPDEPHIHSAAFHVLTVLRNPVTLRMQLRIGPW
jgi:hypothetical protein